MAETDWRKLLEILVQGVLWVRGGRIRKQCGGKEAVKVRQFDSLTLSGMTNWELIVHAERVCFIKGNVFPFCLYEIRSSADVIPFPY